MLVLSRKSGESIHLGGDIVITIIEVRGERVRIGIEAPRMMKVYRGEVLDRIEAAKDQPQFDCLSCFQRFGSADAEPQCPWCHYHTACKVVEGTHHAK